MIEKTRGLPDFERPPVTEVALSVQFEQLRLLRITHLGLLRNLFKEEFPKVEEHPPLDSVVEEFGPRKPPRIELRVEAGPPVPRCWFLNELGTELIQVQQDRFVHNWRKIRGDEQYPRYEFIREAFEKDLNRFGDFIAQEGLGEIVPNQCEVTYVNQIIQGEGWENYGDIEKLFTVWKSEYSDSFLPEAEEVRFAVKYIISKDNGIPLGRLHINVQPRLRINDNKPIIILTLTARGKPIGEGSKGIISFLDVGREWIVRGFTSFTTSRMHKIWERSQ